MMANWIITIPRKIKWEDYERELEAVADHSQVMRYRVRYFPKDMVAGDRCFVTWQNYVRGWMAITGLKRIEAPFTCSTTGLTWPAGKYIERSGLFVKTAYPPFYKGFRGVRKYDFKEYM